MNHTLFVSVLTLVDAGIRWTHGRIIVPYMSNSCHKVGGAVASGKGVRVATVPRARERRQYADPGGSAPAVERHNQSALSRETKLHVSCQMLRAARTVHRARLRTSKSTRPRHYQRHASSRVPARMRQAQMDSSWAYGIDIEEDRLVMAKEVDDKRARVIRLRPMKTERRRKHINSTSPDVKGR